MSLSTPESVEPAAEGRPELYIRVLGRMLEHLGVQMYKRREAALAELVANGWDAGAKSVKVTLPQLDTYDPLNDRIIILDDGSGMDFDEVQSEYLVVGRNKRLSTGAEIEIPGDPASHADAETEESGAEDVALQPRKRRVMGRKGIGKLAGFGLARCMTVTTWKGATALQFRLNIADLKQGDNIQKDVPVTWEWVEPPIQKSETGTQIVLSGLKHRTALNPATLRTSLARRFSRTIQGDMAVTVDEEPLPDPTPPLIYRHPEVGMLTHTFEDGNEVKYWYGFARDVIKSRELRGFSVLVNGKVAQAPPFFFDVEATASGQHSTKYVIGEIEADFIDTGTDDDSDVIATDRQEIDWEASVVQALKTWGEKLSRRVLSDCRDFRGQKTLKEVYEDPDLARRIDVLDEASKKQIRRFLADLSLREGDEDTLKLADSLVRAYEFRQFHDVIAEIEQAAEDPQQLANFLHRLRDWKTLESRAVLEVIQGRLDIIDRFESLIINDAPETAHYRGDTNMHDAIAGFPWLLDPAWQVLSEEKTLTKQLQDWGEQDVPSDEKERYDFLALSDGNRNVIIEIKRSGHPVEYPEVLRILGYKEKLARSRPNIAVVLVYGGTLNITQDEITAWEKSEDRELRKWSDIFKKSREQYERYRAVLQAEVGHPNFSLAKREVLETRSVLEKQTFHRGVETRKLGLGIQDSDYNRDKPNILSEDQTDSHS